MIDTGQDLHGPFQLDEWQRAKLKEWLIEHDKTCSLAEYSGASGGRLSVTFTPTGLGVFASAKCSCCNDTGVDLTDYDSI